MNKSEAFQRQNPGTATQAVRDLLKRELVKDPQGPFEVIDGRTFLKYDTLRLSPREDGSLLLTMLFEGTPVKEQEIPKVDFSQGQSLRLTHMLGRVTFELSEVR